MDSSSSSSIFACLRGDFGGPASSWFKLALLYCLQRCQIRGRQSGLLPSYRVSICSQLSTRDSLSPQHHSLKSQSLFSALIHGELWCQLSQPAFGEQCVGQVLPIIHRSSSLDVKLPHTHKTHNPIYAKTDPRSITSTTAHTSMCCL